MLLTKNRLSDQIIHMGMSNCHTAPQNARQCQYREKFYICLIIIHALYTLHIYLFKFIFIVSS